MAYDDQKDMFSELNDLRVVQSLLLEMNDDIFGKVARVRQLTDLASEMGREGTLFTGGTTTWLLWHEARSSFIHGNYVATVMLCQGLAEHLLASYLEMIDLETKLPLRISFRKTLKRCVSKNVITDVDARNLIRLTEFRNPLSHFRNLDDRSNLNRRAMDTNTTAECQVVLDANFAIKIAIRLLSLPAFRLG